MVSPRHRYIFIHVPKNAGSAIEEALVRHEMNGEGETISSAHDLAAEQRESMLVYCRDDAQHWPLHRIESEIPDAENWKSFGLVSNPWRRVVSEFCYIRQTQPRVVRRHECFAHWDVDYAVRKELIWRYCWKWHDLPQADFFEGAGNPRVFRYEGLDWESVVDYLELSPRVELPRVNVSARKLNHVELLGPEAVDVVFRRYRRDIDRWGFAFEEATTPRDEAPAR